MTEFEERHSSPTISPDGSTIAAHAGDFGVHLWDARRGTRRPLNEDGLFPKWGDENTVYFAASEGGLFTVERMLVDGSAPRKRLLRSEIGMWTTDVSTDGRKLLYYQLHPQTERDIWILPLEDDAEPRSFLVTSASERSAVFGPSGRWIAYLSDITGRDEVYAGRPTGPSSTSGRTTAFGS